MVWSLKEKEKELKPLIFTSGKSQDDVVNEVLKAISNGNKIIFIHGVCGTGKCLDKNILVFCKPKESPYFSYHKISDIVGKEGEILSLDKMGNIVKSKFKNVRETGNKRLFKLKTNTGREIIASENHPFLTITREGVSWASLDKLNGKSYICLPNKINVENSKNYLEDGKLKILGHLISEGKLGDKAGSPKYYQDKMITPLIRQDYVNSLKEIFPEGDIKDEHKTEVKINFYNKDTRFGTTNKLRMLVREFGLDGKKSKDKVIPDVIFNLSEEKIAIFLQALFSGDGSIYTRNGKNNEQMVVEYSSISKRLIQDVSILLSRWGIQHTIISHKFRKNLEYSWRINISNQENVKKYIEKIGFLGEKQNLALSILDRCKIHKFTNIDKTPRIIREYLKNKGYSYAELDRLLNYDKIKELRKNVNFKRIIKDKLTDTPCVFKQGKIDFLRSHLKKVNEYLKDDMLSFICNEQIFWDRVKSIEFLKEDVTYDLEVPEQNNFIANGIIVHNSAIALNIAKYFKKSSIVVPIKNLQRQYENDYTNKMHILKDNGEKLKIKVITGRNNHLCPFLQENNVEMNERNGLLDNFFKPAHEIIENNPNSSCDNRYLPCTIEIKEKNFKRIREFLKQNPNSKLKDFGNIKDVKRLSIASICPYWCPITPSSVDLNLKANKKKYFGLDGKEFTFYQRKPGCGYYDQFNSYIDADVLIFNSQKYLIENVMDRKPLTEIEIIDECDEFLDSFSEYEKINLSRLNFSLLGLFSKNDKTVDLINQIGILSSELMRNPKVQENIRTGDIIPLKDTPLIDLLRLFLDHDIIDSVECDENNYCYHCDEVARIFQHFKEEAYVSFSKEDKDIVAKIVTINLEQRFMELMKKNKVFVMMSGTLHSEKILKEVFGISNFMIIKAEAKHLGNITPLKTGKEMNCSYANFSSGRVNRKQYLLALNECAMKAKMPILIHVTSFNDLPTLKEKEELGLNIMNQERLKKLQENADDIVNKFKRKEMSVLYTTRCNRGIDFPGDMCNSIILTRYPYPNVNSIFWKILKKNKPEYYNELYLDKSRREVLQRIYRGLRSPTDHIFLLSPDSRVFENIKEFE